MLEKIKKAIQDRKNARALKNVQQAEYSPVTVFYQSMVDSLINEYGAAALDKDTGLVKTDENGSLSRETIDYCNGQFCKNIFSAMFESTTVINPFGAFVYADEALSDGETSVIDKDSGVVSDENIKALNAKYGSVPVSPIVGALGAISTNLATVSQSVTDGVVTDINEPLSAVKDAFGVVQDIMSPESVKNACFAINRMIKGAVNISEDKDTTREIQESFLNKLIDKRQDPKTQSRAFLELAAMHQAQVKNAIGFAGEEVTRDQNLRIEAAECCKKAWQVLPVKEKEIKAKAYKLYTKAARSAGFNEKDILPEFSPKKKTEKSR